MLVVKRLVNEVVDIVLPDGVVISVMLVEAGRKAARIGVAAPANVLVLRRELLERSRQEGQCSLQDRVPGRCAIVAPMGPGPSVGGTTGTRPMTAGG